LFMNSHQGCDCFQGSGCTQGMAVHGFSGTDHQLVSVGSKNLAYRAGFSYIICLGTSAMRVYVTDLTRFKAGIR